MNPPETRAAAAALTRLTTALRADLLAVDYTVAGIEELIGPQAAAALHRDQVIPTAWELDRGPFAEAPLAALVRLFLLGQNVHTDQLDAALPTCGASGLRALGLADETGGEVRAAVELRPYQEDGGPPWWVVSDHGEHVLGAALPTDHVLGIGQASLTLAGATIRRPVEAALDLGTGCGIQALHLARHAEGVVATDLSERALWLAGLGLALSEVSAELRAGDLFAPVGDESFDLIVANPPFVITPRVAGVPQYTYRDGGRPGDELVSALVTSVGRRLRPGGIAQLLGNWEVGRGEEWTDRLTGWLDAAADETGAQLDAWVIQRDLLDPADYAALWARDGGATGRARDDLVRAWLDDFAGRGVQAIGLGLITLRRPGPGTRAFRRLEARPEPTTALGAHLERCLRNHDLLADPLQARLRVAPDVRELREHRPGAEEPTRILCTQQDGFARQVVLDTAMAALVGACDGELPVGVLAAAIAQLLDLDPDAVTRETELTVGELVLSGFLSVTV